MPFIFSFLNKSIFGEVHTWSVFTHVFLWPLKRWTGHQVTSPRWGWLDCRFSVQPVGQVASAPRRPSVFEMSSGWMAAPSRCPCGPVQEERDWFTYNPNIWRLQQGQSPGGHISKSLSWENFPQTLGQHLGWTNVMLPQINENVFQIENAYKCNLFTARYFSEETVNFQEFFEKMTLLI